MSARDSIEVRVHGQAGHTLVVLHGGPGAPGSAHSLASALAPEYRVLEPLQRWSGEQPLTVASHVDDLARVAPERAVLVGHSWGAMLALSYASLLPERVVALALVGCGTYDEHSREVYQRSFSRRLGATGAQQLRAVRDRMQRAPSEVERDALRAEQAVLAAEAMTVDALWTAESLRVDARGNRETWEDVLRLQRTGVEPARFSGIRAPALMLHGDDDPHPGSLTHAVLRAQLPQLEYVSFPRCGHEPWRERHAREPFLRALLPWLRRQTAA